MFVSSSEVSSYFRIERCVISKAMQTKHITDKNCAKDKQATIKLNTKLSERFNFLSKLIHKLPRYPCEYILWKLPTF